MLAVFEKCSTDEGAVIGDKLRLDKGLAIFKVESTSVSKQHTLILVPRCGEEELAVDRHQCSYFLWNIKSRFLTENAFFPSVLLKCLSCPVTCP